MKRSDENLAKTQLEVLKTMRDWGDNWFGISLLAEEANLSESQVKRDLKVLLEKEIVYFFRGGFSEDGEICGGSGYGICKEGYVDRLLEEKQ
ncbi:MAG: hypothetical protein LBG64_00925 [Pseudomonadales bacterium]|jgi:predicted transcriptional regulator|nr:hypothetical protein [Pseudomonadales bacterium]